MADPNNNQTGTPIFIYYLVALGVFGTIFYIYFHNEVIEILIKIKVVEAEIVNVFTGKLSHILAWVNSTPVDAVTLNDISIMSSQIGFYFMIVAVALSVVLTTLLWFFHPKNNLAATHNMHTLMGSMQKSFPNIIPISGKEIDKLDISNGEWQMALTPVEFMKHHKILTKSKKVNSNKAIHIFSQQLGAPWEDYNELSVLEQALFGILAAYTCYDRTSADMAIKEISASTKEDELDFTSALDLFEKYKDKPEIIKIVKSHHYVLTVFSSLVESARNSGIVSTASFLWLKAMNRTLWYTCNNVGRRAVFIEAAAVRAHWLAEVQMKCAIAAPVLNRTIDGLNQVFKTVDIDEN